MVCHLLPFAKVGQYTEQISEKLPEHHFFGSVDTTAKILGVGFL